MSDEIIRGRVEADISGYKRGMQEAGKATEDFRRQAETGARGAGALGQTLGSVASDMQGFSTQASTGAETVKALAFQLLQGGAAFGVVGAALGAVVAVLPNLAELLGVASQSTKTLKEATSDLNGSLGDVGRTVKTFDMENLYAQFNAANQATREAIIEQLNFQRTFIETRRLVSSKAMGESLSGLGEYSTLNKLAGAFGATGAEKLAGQLGISEDVAARLLPTIKGLRDGTEDVSLAFEKFGVVLLGGNEKAVELARSMSDLTKTERDSYSASSALSEALSKMAKGHVVTRKEMEAAEKAAKKLKDTTKETSDEIERLLLKLGEKEDEKAAKALADYNKEQEKYLGSLADQAAALETQVEQYGLTKAQIAETTLARAEEELQIKRGLSGNESQIALLETEVELRRRIAESARSIESRDAGRRAADQAEREWQRITDGVGDALSDAIFKGGADGWQMLRRTIESTVIRAVVQPIVSNAIGGTMQSMGIGGGGSSGGGFNSFGSLANTALGPLGGTAGVVSGLSSLAAGTALGSFGAGMASGIASFGSLSSSMATFGAGASAGGSVGAGMMLGTAMPYIAAALAIGQALGAFKGPSYHTGSAVMTGTDDAQTRLGHLQYVPGQTRQGVWGGFTEVDARGGSAFTDPLKTLGKALTDTYEQALAVFGVQAKAAAYTAFGADNNDPSNGLFMLYDQSGRVVARNTTNDAGNHYAKDPKQGLEQFAQDATTLTARAIVTKLRETDLEDAIDAIFDSIDPAKASLEQLNAAIAAAQAWMAQAEQFRAAISEAFDSPMERLQARFVKLGLAIPQTVDAYEALVRAQNLGTQSGRDAVAGLLDAKNLWDQVQADQMQAAEAAARAAEEALAAWTRLRDDLTAFRGDLTTGALAGLSPEAAYRAAQAQFTDTSRLAGLGNQDALAQLEAVSRALLEASRAYNAGTAAYYADRDLVLGAVDSGLALTGRKIAGYADGGLFGGGLRIVGERGPEIEATGPARIWSAQQAQAMLGGGNAEVVRELQAVVRVLSTGLASMDKRLANLERSGDEQARVARLAADRRAA